MRRVFLAGFAIILCMSCQSKGVPTSPEVYEEKGEPVHTPNRPVTCPTEAFLHSGAVGASLGIPQILDRTGLPKNARQTAEGYWIGAEPSLSELDALYARDVRVILTAAQISRESFRAFKNRMAELGMTHIYIPFGGRFPNPQKFNDALEGVAPEQIYIHCAHGGDRSGAILAYLLIVNHGWTIPRALLAVAFPGPRDAQKLVELLRSRGFVLEQSEIDAFLGMYSAENNGGYGGLKVRSDGYVKLINTMIDAAERRLQNASSLR